MAMLVKECTLEVSYNAVLDIKECLRTRGQVLSVLLQVEPIMFALFDPPGQLTTRSRLYSKPSVQNIRLQK